MDISQAPILSFASPPTTIKQMDPLHRLEIMHALEISDAAIVSTAELCNGPTWQFFELASVADVLAMDSSKVRWPEYKAIGLFAAHAVGGECDFEVRMLAPSSGMSEDPITGSLNAAIAKWMQFNERLQKPYLVAQGTNIGRLGRVAVKATTDGVAWIGGQVHIVIEGNIII